MNIDTMRWIDRRAGVPICFALSILKGMKNLFFKSSPFKKNRKILFIEMSEMGSMVLAYPLFKKTKELYPEAVLHFLTFKKNRYAIDMLDIIPQENVLTIDDQNFLRFLTSSIASLRKLRKTKLTTVIDMEFFSRFTSIFSFFCRAKETVGYYRYSNEGLYRGTLLTHRVVYNSQIHTSLNLLNLIHALASDGKDLPLPKKPLEDEALTFPQWPRLSEAARKNILEKLITQNANIAKAEKIVLLNPNASDIIPLRRWPVENYSLLARRLLEHTGTFVVITGVEAERPTGEKICRSLNPEKCLNFAGMTSFSELMDLYGISDVLITNDSGPAHFSAMTDIKTFVFFGPETPKLYGPLGKNSYVFYSHFACSPCVSVFNHRRSPCRDNKCLKAISVQEVYEKVKKELTAQ